MATFRTGFQSPSQKPAGLSGLNSLTSKAMKKKISKAKMSEIFVGAVDRQKGQSLEGWDQISYIPRGMFILTRFCLHPKHREASASGVTKTQSWRRTKQAPRPAWPWGPASPHPGPPPPTPAPRPSAPGGLRRHPAGGRWSRTVLKRRHRPGTARLYDFHDNRGHLTRPARPASRCAPRPNSARAASRSPGGSQPPRCSQPGHLPGASGPRRPRLPPAVLGAAGARARSPAAAAPCSGSRSRGLRSGSRCPAPVPARGARSRGARSPRCSSGPPPPLPLRAAAAAAPGATPAASPRMRAPPAPGGPALARQVLLRSVSCGFLQNSRCAL